MKAYIVKVELEDSNPLIWRRVIMPAGATYNRLHDVIQTVTNFRSGYPSLGYHLFAFDLTEENVIVTNDEEAYEDHQHYKKNEKIYWERLKTVPQEMLQFELRHQERLKKEVRKPTGLKIDKYLEKYRQIQYTYDFGDDWHFKINLEEIVDDYYFGYPTLLDGAETAPPEDVGGIHAFYDFLEAYQNRSHPGHKDAKEWADMQYFREYNPGWINRMLKGISYKKTEWNMIDHKNYKVIKDKYRSDDETITKN